MNGAIEASLAWRQTLAALLLPPLGLLLLGGLAGLLAWRGRRWAGLLAAFACLGVLLLATPVAASLLRWSLERELVAAPVSGLPPGAIIILGAEVAHGVEGGVTVGPLTLERLRAGAALHRSTGLPLLVTAGVLAAGDPPLAQLMAASLAEDFRTPARWIEPSAADTAQNAGLSAVMLRADGIEAAYIVSHAWHLPRALGAFARRDFAVVPAPVMPGRGPAFGGDMWLPRADNLSESWFMLREWVGRVFYAWRG